MTQAQFDDAPSDDFLRDVLEAPGAIALVGLSNNPARDSHMVFLDLIARGFRVVGVNPGLAGKEIGGAPVYARLADVPGPIAIVDVFRNSEAAGETIDEALALRDPPRAIWLQLGVVNEAGAARARARGVKVVMDRCIKVDARRLGARPAG